MIAWLAYAAAGFAVRHLPPAVADRVCLALARMAFHAGLPVRRAQEDNLARLLGKPGPASPRVRRAIRRRARESFEHFALALSDFLRLDVLGREALVRSVEVRGERHLAAARSAGRGVILLSAHLGNWEWGAAGLAARGTPLHVIARPHPSERVERLFRRRRRAWGISSLPWSAPGRGAAAALRRGEWVAMMADRPSAPGTPPRAPSAATTRPRRASTCAFAAALARRTGAVVLPAVMIHLPGRRHAACFEPPVLPCGPGPADGAVTGAAAALRSDGARGEGFRATLRRYLMRYPGQWCAFEPVSEALG